MEVSKLRRFGGLFVASIGVRVWMAKFLMHNWQDTTRLWGMHPQYLLL